MLKELRVRGYRSLRALRLPVGRCTVVVGPNGCGKTNLYNALRFTAESIQGRLAETVRAEGGLPSLLWAGGREKGPVRLECGLLLDAWDYQLVVGLPPRQPRAEHFDPFPWDPWIKSESLVEIAAKGKRTAFLEREGGTIHLRESDGSWRKNPYALLHFESALDQISDAIRYPELRVLPESARKWRFYHHFPTDEASPLRRSQVGVSSAALAHHGDDLASVIRMVQTTGQRESFDEFVDRAFPRASVSTDDEANGHVGILMRMPGLIRPLSARELSDGTLRYLCLLAALLPPRPPNLIALNEPETSLHPDLLPPLARLIAQAAKESQVWVTTHSHALADDIAGLTETTRIELEMAEGETRIVGQGLLDRL